MSGTIAVFSVFYIILDSYPAVGPHDESAPVAHEYHCSPNSYLFCPESQMQRPKLVVPVTEMWSSRSHTYEEPERSRLFYFPEP